ncbi:MAG: SRPBCC domain-containing protein [Pseudomonadota bacterium]
MKDEITRLPPLQKSVTVPLPRDKAFTLFTNGMGKWWPGESHSLSARDGQTPQKLEVEPHVGGRIWETTHDGRRLPWARITEWEPGQRFGFDWHVGQDEEDATQVLVVFSHSDLGTRVDLTHGGFDRTPAGTEASASYDSGWDLVLNGCFGKACRAFVAA